MEYCNYIHCIQKKIAPLCITMIITMEAIFSGHSVLHDYLWYDVEHDYLWYY